ncbi:MAG: hypothetical protein HS117_08490 [Verrucomicrobiaceae bacterium]|nr:hypothetical protein [Verrucomicrobiaceae bacterium]
MNFTRNCLGSLAKCRILVIGDVMLDHFIWGHVRRISPEAPVPIVEVTREEFYPGGAANVARNISPFSPHTHLMGRVGKDIAAARLRDLLVADKVDPDPLLVHETLPTISKARVSARQQQIVRVDREKLLPLSLDECIEVKKRLDELAPKLDAIILEDYGKGFITPALVKVVSKVAQKHKLIVTVDPSPRNQLPDWEGVTLVKPNRLEAFAAAGIEDNLEPVPPIKNTQLKNVGWRLLEKWKVPSVLITLGEQGMILFQRDQPIHHIPTRAREVYDVSGAGDTAIALLTLALAAGFTLQDAADIANHASGIVVGKLGTATLTPDELLAAFA